MDSEDTSQTQTASSQEKKDPEESTTMTSEKPEWDKKDLVKAKSSIKSHVSYQSHLIDMLSSSSSSDSLNDDEESGKGSDGDLKGVATNREAFGTWNRPLDFTLTCIGYIIGIHNFFRFSHLCYKYGTWSFMLPYLIMLTLIGLPLVVMECTIGQFYGVGSVSAFRQLSPIITGVSYVLAWNSFVNWWMYAAIITWLRAYSGDSLSCLKGWLGCSEEHFFNTPFCYTSELDNCCNYRFESTDQFVKCPPSTYPSLRKHGSSNQSSEEMIYYNFGCIDICEFCSYFGWKCQSEGDKMCTDSKNNSMSIYSRRFHATTEYFYGYVVGMKKAMVTTRWDLVRKKCFEAKNPGWNCNSMEFLRESVDMEHLRRIAVTDPKYLSKYFTKHGQSLTIDPESSSFIQLPIFSLTTCLFITFFLFNHLLNVSSVTYFLNGAPFVILVYLMIISFQFSHSSIGLVEFSSTRGFVESFTNWRKALDIWGDAVIQVIITTGVGNGAMISLASFNKYRHEYLFDIGFVMLLNIMTSVVATVIYFIAIAQYIHEYDISVPFENFIVSQAHYSSLEFGFIANSYFLTLIEEYEVTILLYLFMLSSFPTDTIIRLAQNILDAAVQVLPRLRYHSTMALIAVAFFGWISLLPMTRNGGLALFIEYEYFALRYAIPTMTLIEVVAVAWVYKASRMMDDADHLEVIFNVVFRKFFVICIKWISPLLLVLTILCNYLTHYPERLAGLKSARTILLTDIFGWLFCITPIFLFVISILKELAATPRDKWDDLYKPMVPRRTRRLKHKMKSLQTKPLIGITKENTERNSRKSHESNFLRNSQDNVAEPQNLYMNGEKENAIYEWVNSNSKKKSGENPQQERKHTYATLDLLEDSSSMGSSLLAVWKSYIRWNQICAYLEDWPERLDDTEVESEGSSVESTGHESLEAFQNLPHAARSTLKNVKSNPDTISNF